MTDVFLPVPVTAARISYRYIDSVGVSGNPYNGVQRTASRGGDRLGLTLDFTPQGGASSQSQMARRRLIATLATCRGRINRLWVSDLGYRQAGSFPAPELITNGDFSNGTTGWTAASASTAPTLSASDGVLRIKSVDSSNTPQAYQQAPATAVLYAPYVARAMMRQGNAVSGGAGYTVQWYDGTASILDYKISGGLSTAAGVTNSTSPVIGPYLEASGYIMAGTFFDVLYASLARCILADGSPNGFLYSDQFDNAAWTKTGCSIAANDTVAPDGTTTADALVETTSTTKIVSRSLVVSSSALDLSTSFCAKAGTRSWAYVAITDFAGNNGYAYVNLSTGAVGTTTITGNVTNVRAHVVSMGNGWYRVHVTARKTSSQTTMYGYVGPATADNTSFYAGTDAAKAIYLWRGGMAVSGVPFMPGQTTSAAVSTTTQSGSSLRVKGLPVSTTGLLLASDMVEIQTSLGSQLVILTSSLDSDAAGCGVLQFSPPIRGTVANDAWIIVNSPIARCIYSGPGMEWMTEPGIITTASIDLEESPT
jgi:hypothetical protein